jgi:hypothetical protein
MISLHCPIGTSLSESGSEQELIEAVIVSKHSVYNIFFIIDFFKVFAIDFLNYANFKFLKLYLNMISSAGQSSAASEHILSN